MSVGDLENFKDALNRAVFAALTMEGIKDNVRFRGQLIDQFFQVALDVDFRDVITFFTERRCAGARSGGSARW